MKKKQGWEAFEAVIYEKCPCDSLKECRVRERVAYDTLHPVLNTHKPHNYEQYDCKHEYRAQHYVDNCERIREAKKQYSVSNKEHVRNAERQYREANSERIREAKKQYREANKDYIREAKRQYSEANRERLREASKQWREANPEYQLRYREAKKAQAL
jgi:hypothetical protein